MSRLLVTGARGFVGQAVCDLALAEGWEVLGTSRRPDPDRSWIRATGPLGPLTDWAGALDKVEVVIHLAARVHVMRETERDADRAFTTVNFEGTRRLAEQAARAGVRRLVFLSTVKVHGEATAGRPWSEADPPAPSDAYARSKLAAESCLRALGDGGGLEIVVVRPPLVHGPGVGGNLRRLLDLLARRVPLPFGGVANARSLVGRDNLATFLLRVARHPSAPGEVFLLADRPSLSTPELLRRLAAGLGVAPRLFEIPASLMRAATRVPAVGPALGRLTGSLEVDSSKAERLTEWQPAVALDEGLMRMCRWYRETLLRT